MWELEEDGRGRRAVIHGIRNEKHTFRLGNFVENDEFVGVIAGFRRGETDSLHETQLLVFPRDMENGEVLASPLLKWFPLSEINQVIPSPNVVNAVSINWPKTQTKIPIEEPLPVNTSVPELANYISSLFTTRLTPSKRASPNKRVSPSKRISAGAHRDRPSTPTRAPTRPPGRTPRQMLTESSDGFSDDDSSDEEAELVLARKRSTKKAVKKMIKSDPFDTPRKTPPMPDIISTPIKGETTLFDEEEYAEVWPETHSQKLKVLPEAPPFEYTMTLADRAIAALHPASEPKVQLCRDDQFDRLFLALESAIAAETGTCVYVSGTPGTGKTSTIREVIAQLDLRIREKELNPFIFLEINGMKLAHPNAAYEHLWSVLDRGIMASSNAMTALEAVFSSNEDVSKRGVIVVLLDELDQLVTKGQQLIYNFFNWPSLPHSRLVVIAVANTMDLPERMLSNKISSRVGLTRIQFPGYTYSQLEKIVLQRLSPDFLTLIEADAVDYATRKVASVGGDARRVLDFVSQAISSCQSSGEVVKTNHVRDVIIRSQQSPMGTFLETLGTATKVFLCAFLARVRRTSNTEVALHDVLKQARTFVKSSADARVLAIRLYPGNSGRLASFQNAVNELIESGVIVQQAIAGEATANIRLMIAASAVREHLEKDPMLHGMI